MDIADGRDFGFVRGATREHIPCGSATEERQSTKSKDPRPAGFHQTFFPFMMERRGSGLFIGLPKRPQSSIPPIFHFELIGLVIETLPLFVIAPAATCSAANALLAFSTTKLGFAAAALKTSHPCGPIAAKARAA
jgi:hypothetical protein